MKILWVMMVLGILLTGCAGQQMETVSDGLEAPQIQQTAELQIRLPEDAVTAVLQAEDGRKLYFCSGYEVAVQKIRAEDLTEALEKLSGMPPARMTVMRTKQAGLNRYDCVWSSAGERGAEVFRSAIVHHGNTYYSVTCMAAAEQVPSVQAQWNQLLAAPVLSLQKTP